MLTRLTCLLTGMRLENEKIDSIYAGVCILVQLGRTIRRTENKPHASVVEWNDEIMLCVLPVAVLISGLCFQGPPMDPSVSEFVACSSWGPRLEPVKFSPSIQSTPNICLEILMVSTVGMY